MKTRAFSLLLVVTAACAGAPPTTSLKLTGNVLDASVTIDNQDVGSLRHVAKHGVALPPGKHTLTVEKQGYFPFDQVVEASGAPVTIDVKLEPVPD